MNLQVPITKGGAEIDARGLEFLWGLVLGVWSL
jgi:hypothetical protein